MKPVLIALILYCAACAQGQGNLMKPETLNAKAPDVYMVRLETSKGNIVIRVDRSWAPHGADRFYNLVQAGYYDNNYFFRVLDFMAQVGLNSKPEITKIWADKNIPDDPVRQSNQRGMVTMAAGGAPNSRSTQFFINKINNERLDPLGFAPFGEVTEGLDVLDMIYGGYQEDADQSAINAQGEPYLNRYFPRMDKIVRARVLPR